MPKSWWVVVVTGVLGAVIGAIVTLIVTGRLFPKPLEVIRDQTVVFDQQGQTERGERFFFTTLEALPYDPPQPRTLAINAATRGVTTGITIRVMIARADRGPLNPTADWGETRQQVFRYELGVREFSQEDRPKWDASDQSRFPPGEYWIKAEAKHGTEWKNTAIRIIRYRLF